MAIAEKKCSIHIHSARSPAYSSSSAATAVNVGPAPQTPRTPEVAATDLTPLYYGIAVAAIAIIIAIVIVGALILRKKQEADNQLQEISSFLLLN